MTLMFPYCWFLGMSIIIHLSLQNGNGRSSLMEACKNGNAAVVDLLLDNGADFNAQDEVSSTSPAQ